MLRAVRSLCVPSHGVRFLPMLFAWCSILGGPLAATCARAGPSEWLAANTDSVPSATPATSVPPVGSGTVPSFGSATARPQKLPNYSLHLHGGLFAPIDVNATSPTIGLRFARNVGGHLQTGLLTGWTLRRKNLEQPVPGLPGLKPHLVLARLDGQLLPLMGFFQVNLTEKRFLIPYAGIAAGYEWLSIKANDYRTDQEARATYSNWAWETWGGIGMRLDKMVRVDGELFYNGGSLERDVTDSSGQTFREAIDANGVGARLGLGIQF
jgi:hypothetical protein